MLRLRRHLQLAETERANTVLGCVAALAEKHPGGTRGERIRRVAALGRIEMAVFTQDYAAAARIKEAEALLAEARARRIAGSVLDRDAAVTSDGETTPALELINGSTALAGVSAVQNQAIYVMPADYYLTEDIYAYIDVLGGLQQAFTEHK